MFQLFLIIYSVIYVCKTLSLSYINLTISDSMLINSIRAENNAFTWIQEVIEYPNSQSKRVFIRSHLSNFSTLIPNQDKLYDLKNELILQSYQEVSLSCVLFRNKTQDKYFIYKFPSNQNTLLNPLQVIYLPDSLLNSSYAHKIKLSKDCSSVNINFTKTYVYTAYLKYSYLTRRQTSLYHWKNVLGYSTDFNVIGSDDQFNILVTTDCLYQKATQKKMIFQIVNDERFLILQEDFHYYESIKLQLANFTSSKIKYAYYNESSGPSNFAFSNLLKMIVFAVKNQVTKYSYSVYILKENSSSELEIMKNVITGTALTQPVFEVSQNLTRLIVYGNTTSGSPFYLGYYINFTQRSLTSIIFPQATTSYNNFIKLNQNFLYIRKKALQSNNKTTHSLYRLMKHKLAAYFQLQQISDAQYAKNWITSYLNSPVQDTFMSTNLTIYHLHAYYTQHYYDKNDIQSFEYMENSQYDTFVEMYLFSLNATVYGIAQVFRWAYFNETDKKIYLTVYNSSVNTTKMTHFSFELLDTSYVLQNKFSKYLDCFMTFSQNDLTMDLYQVDFQSQKAEKKGQILWPGTLEQYKIALNNFQFSDNCSIVKLGSNIYTFNETSSSFDVKNDVFDINANYSSNFIYKVNGSILYEFDGKQFVQIAASQFLAFNLIQVDTTKSKLIVTSISKQRDQFSIKVFYKSTQTLLWSQIPSTTNITSSLSIEKFLIYTKVSDNLQKTAICYSKYRNTSQPRNECLFKFINFTANSSFQTAYELDFMRYPQLVNVENNYIYLAQAKQMNLNNQSIISECIERIINQTVNSSNYQILYSYQVQCDYYQNNFHKRQIVQAENYSFYVFSEYIEQNSSIKLIKSPLRNIMIMEKQLSLAFVNRGFFYQNSTLYLCTPGCYSCYNSYFCLNCYDGYTLDMKTQRCIKCQGYCSTCNSSNLSQCYSCPVGFYYNSSTISCERCNMNCTSCFSSTIQTCLTCSTGYFLNDVSIEPRKKLACLPCPSNCDTCFNTTLCTNCSYGYSVNSTGGCVQCPLDCVDCDASNVTNCLSCRSGFEMVTADGKISCTKCPNYCSVCSNGVCSTCYSGYTLSSSDNVCYENCISPCLTCSLNDSTSCKSCIPLYTLVNTTCLPDVSCNINSTCISCPSSYVLISKKCYSCPVSENCAECISSDPTNCVSCARGFYLFGSKCSACSSDCDECYAGSVCSKCKSGTSQKGKSGGSCTICANNCKTCSQSATNCETCSDNFNLVGTSCLSVKTVSFSFKINLDISNFTNQIYYLILDELANITDKTTDQIRITSFKSGSTQIQGSVDVANTTEESYTMSLLGNHLSAGSLIAGQQILSSSFTGFSNEPLVPIFVPPTQSNLLLILVFVIPGSIIIIGVTMVVIYKKFFSVVQFPPNQDYSDKSSTEKDFSQQTSKVDAEPQRKDGFLPKARRKTFISKH